MPFAASIKLRLFRKKTNIPELAAGAAYDLWANNYDRQPDNLMLQLDERIFTHLLKKVDIRGKRVVDMGCGTGRHWPAIQAQNPLSLIGYDVSEGMLHQLQEKYPDAITHLIDKDFPIAYAEAGTDCLICTLTVAHIRNIEAALRSWMQMIKPGGTIILTDFHPALLNKGGKRSFTVNGKTMAVVNHVHAIEKISNCFEKHGFVLHEKIELIIDESMKQHYLKQHALDLYNKYLGMPVIYGLLFKKEI